MMVGVGCPDMKGPGRKGRAGGRFIREFDSCAYGIWERGSDSCRLVFSRVSSLYTPCFGLHLIFGTLVERNGGHRRHAV